MLARMRETFLNVDAGELDREPEELYRLAHVVNCAAGGHAGDAASMVRVVDACKRFRTRLGVHPSYPDPASFGRRSLAMPPSHIRSAVAEQCAALYAIASARGVGLHYIKPHGALYHDADREPAIAAAVVEGVLRSLPRHGLTLIGPAPRLSNGALAGAAHAAGLAFAREGFADRGMRADGSLLPRSEPGALLGAEQAIVQAKSLAASGAYETLCVHGDGPDAVTIARAVRGILE